MPPTFSQVAESERKAEAARADDHVLRTAVDNEWALYGGQRALERHNTTFTPQEGYSVPDTTKDELSRLYGYEVAQ
ncbi:hypothetical protein, partial [Enterobacter hormaechei]